MNHTPEYLSHLNSPAWKEIRRQAIEAAGFKCQDCDLAAVDLEVHHITYDRLGNEKAADLRVLCPPCHRKADKQREWISRVSGYAFKRWGEDWVYEREWDEAVEAFERFLERSEA